MVTVPALGSYGGSLGCASLRFQTDPLPERRKYVSMKSQAGEAERTGVKSDHEEAIPFPILVGTPSQSLGPVSEETGPSAV